METIEFTIRINTEKKLTEKEVKLALVDMQHRLMGFHTECPKCLKGSDIMIGIKKEDNE